MSNRALKCPMPDNINPLYPANFIFSVHKAPELTFFVQDVNMPDMSLGNATYATPLTDIPVPGDKINFGQLTISFLVDEKFSNYSQLTEWMLALGFPDDHQRFTSFTKKQENNLSEHLKTVSDATLGIIDAANHPVATYTFIDCFPISLGGWQYSSKNTDTTPITATVTFLFDHFKLQTKWDEDPF